MRSFAALFVAGVLATCATACSSSGSTTFALRTDHPPANLKAPGTSIAATRTRSSPTARSTRAGVEADGSAFCAEARKIGLRGIDVGGDGSGADPTGMLTGVDELAALAPTQIRDDFRLFDRFEHAVLGAQKGRPIDLEKLNSPPVAQAMKRVGTYLADTCGISR